MHHLVFNQRVRKNATSNWGGTKKGKGGEAERDRESMIELSIGNELPSPLAGENSGGRDVRK